jgi:hypothetical protein
MGWQQKSLLVNSIDPELQERTGMIQLPSRWRSESNAGRHVTHQLRTRHMPRLHYPDAKATREVFRQMKARH